MKAFVMCAGLGTRLLPLTLKTPKPMMKLNNKPILCNTIDILRQSGIKDIVINLHFMPEMIKNYFENGKDFGVNIDYSFEEELMGTAGGLGKVRNKFIDDSFVVMSGDGLVDLDLKKIIEFHKSKKSIATIVLKKYDFKLKYGVIFTDENNRINDFVEKPEIKDIYENKVNTGIYIFEPEIFKYIPENTFCDFGKNIFPKLLEKNIPFYAYETTDYWCDIGNIDAYKIAQHDILTNKIKNSKIFFNDIFEGNYKILKDETNFIGKNNIFGINVKVEDHTVIGNNCIIENNVYLKNTIVCDGVVIKENCRLENCILLDNCIIQRDTAVNFGIFI